MTSKEGLHKYYYDKTYQLIDVIYPAAIVSAGGTPDQRTSHYEYDIMGNRVYAEDMGEELDYTLKPNGLNQYDAVSKSTHNIDVKGQVTGTYPAVTVNNIKAKVTGADYLAEEVTLKSGINTITATAVNSKATASKSINVTLDTAADKLFTYDSNGSLTKTTFGAKQADYTYDYENRLVKASSLGGPAHSSALYKYDYLGRRIEKNIGGTITKYIYDGDSIIAEYDGNGTLIARYVFGPGIDEPIRLERSGTICYYHFDGLGSVTDLSNSSGQQAEHYYYDPFGKTKIYNAQGKKLADSACNNRYMFTAREWDSESGLYYYRARMYNPKLGRFLQADPVGYKADINLYRYCGNNPINRIDPSGLEGKDKNGPKRPDETWNDYWARQRTARAQRLLKSGLQGAAAQALGAKGSLLGNSGLGSLSPSGDSSLLKALADSNAAEMKEALKMLLEDSFGKSLGTMADALENILSTEGIGSLLGGIVGGGIGGCLGAFTGHPAVIIGGVVIGGAIGEKIGSGFDYPGSGSLNYQEWQ